MPTEPLTITEAAQLIRSGELTPSELLDQCLRRIDKYEPYVHAWVFVDRERAMRDAAIATDEIAGGKYRGELHGIPIGIKDIIDVFDMPTGCGSKHWANSIARQEADCVKRLRQAGAIILGKTVTTPFAFTDPAMTRNPWNLERTPGGSSSGSAAAVACGMCLAALGTQTGGSLTRPASYCGVCSLKPTYGRVSVNGVLPLAPSLDHVGVIGACVRDLALVFEVIAGPHAMESLGIGSCYPTPDMKWALKNTTMAPLGMMGGLFAELVHPEVQTCIEALATNLGKGVTSIHRIAQPAGFHQVLQMHRTIMAVEAAQFHAERSQSRPEDYPQNIMKLIEDGLNCSALEYRQARVARDQIESEIEHILNDMRLIACSATRDFAPDRTTTGDAACNAPWSFTGQPTISIPYHWADDGRSLSVQLVGSHQGEAELFAAAARIEQAVSRPRTLPTHELEQCVRNGV